MKSWGSERQHRWSVRTSLPDCCGDDAPLDVAACFPVLGDLKIPIFSELAPTNYPPIPAVINPFPPKSPPIGEDIFPPLRDCYSFPILIYETASTTSLTVVNKTSISGWITENCFARFSGCPCINNQEHRAPGTQQHQALYRVGVPMFAIGNISQAKPLSIEIWKPCSISAKASTCRSASMIWASASPPGRRSAPLPRRPAPWVRPSTPPGSTLPPIRSKRPSGPPVPKEKREHVKRYGNIGIVQHHRRLPAAGCHAQGRGS